MAKCKVAPIQCGDDELTLLRCYLLLPGGQFPIKYIGVLLSIFRSAYPENGIIQLVFLARTVFFSHNKSTRIVFRLVFSAKRTGGLRDVKLLGK